MADSRETKLRRAFVVGYPIKHSRSPLIHGHWLSRYGLQGSYESIAIQPDDFPDFLKGLKLSGYRGGNVTIPHKEAACQLADCPDELSQELGAANTLWLDEGRLCATNTDGEGFVANLDQQRPGWEHTETAVILGAGGASRAVVQAIRNRGVKTIHIVNRSLERARELADRFGASIHPHALAGLNEVLQGAGLFVNTTSLGMTGDPLPDIDWRSLRPDALVTDIVYTPLETPLLRQARAHGFATVDGLGMLLHQAVPGFEIWFGVRPKVDEALRQVILDDLQEKAA
ncbi:shikimate dehydrogenase [Allorhizobium sp. BGMRC 0089]|uniref:shikimate dehydrogenase n=1 Tax=Allorhizobium sonneratiae TaxID=2934936 RepID=UPI002033BC03|nr:shikimate dehydrogenase [Allorhizobium sonneratiae]MCM2294402.1 shikimate dehydrogenase [Allorhizobium sonneratiae]